MAQPSEPSAPLPLSARPAHLSIRAGDFVDRAARWAKDSQEQLRTFWKIRLSLTKASGPDVPVIVAGETALALNECSQSNPRINPRRAQSKMLKALAVPPHILVLVPADLAHIERLFSYVADSWLTERWADRVLCAEPHTDESTLRKNLQQLELEPDEVQWRSDIYLTSRGLARVAGEFRQEIDVQIDPLEAGDPEYIHVHLLDRHGVELAAWADFAEHLAMESGTASNDVERSTQESEAAVARMASILFRTRSAETPESRLPQDTYIGRSVIGTPREVVRTFFRLAMQHEDAVALGASRVGLDLERAYEQLESFEAHLTRPTRVERGKSWS